MGVVTHQPGCHRGTYVQFVLQRLLGLDRLDKITLQNWVIRTEKSTAHSFPSVPFLET